MVIGWSDLLVPACNPFVWHRVSCIWGPEEEEMKEKWKKI
jgi:hypothetical protein